MEQNHIELLIERLTFLPGVGKKTAQRLCYFMLEKNREKALSLAHAIENAMEKVTHCNQCYNLSNTPTCDLCLDPKRDPERLCIVESPQDVLAIEQTHSFHGQYFVLMGRLSPLDGIGPEDLRLPQLFERIRKHGIKEVILATNTTVEGEATAYYIQTQLSKDSVTLSRIAHGVPMGGELEYLDSHTISQALMSRHIIEEETVS